MTDPSPQYAGFWIRVGASLIDTVLLLCIIYPLLIAIYGWSYLDAMQTSLAVGVADVLLSYVLPAVAAVMFWLYRQATPGKMLLKLKVVDAKTGGPLSVGQAIVRYLGYFVATIPLCFGFFWIGFDAKKQGWHDKMAGTFVVHTKAPPSQDAPAN